MKRFWKIFWLAALLPVVFGFLDVLGYQIWLQVGGWTGEVYSKVDTQYSTFFWTFAYLKIIAVALTYYIMRKDKSETAAILITPFILLHAGLEDLTYFIVSGISLTSSHPGFAWLTDRMPIPTFVSNLLGSTEVTGTALLVSSALGLVVAYFVAKKLEAYR